LPQAEIDPVDRFQARTGRHSWLPRVPLFVAEGDIGRQFESAHQHFVDTFEEGVYMFIDIEALLSN